MNQPSNQEIFRARAIIVLTFFGLLLLCAANVWAFRAFFDKSYLKWYANAGPFVALATAAFGAAWGGLDKNPALISANPLRYFAACMGTAGLPLIASSAHLQSKNQPKRLGLEAYPLLMLGIVEFVAMLAWLVLIVPAQYFLFLIAGSFSRAALTSSARISARLQSGEIEFKETAVHDRPKPEDGWWDASMRNKPVTLTSAYGGALLFVVSLFWE